MALQNKDKVQLPFYTKNITFNKVDILSSPKNITRIKEWIVSTILSEQKNPGFISFNFCTDKYLLKINKQYLQHNYYTDIITFDMCEGKIISGDIYISWDRVKENAKSENTLFHVELQRVIIHGVLHLCGYKDKSAKDQKQMRDKENYYLSLLSK